MLLVFAEMLSLKRVLAQLWCAFVFHWELSVTFANCAAWPWMFEKVGKAL